MDLAESRLARRAPGGSNWHGLTVTRDAAGAGAGARALLAYGPLGFNGFVTFAH